MTEHIFIWAPSEENLDELLAQHGYTVISKARNPIEQEATKPGWAIKLPIEPAMRITYVVKNERGTYELTGIGGKRDVVIRTARQVTDG
jgi:hypothetical protein